MPSEPIPVSLEKTLLSTRKPWSSDKCQCSTFIFTAAMPSRLRLSTSIGMKWRLDRKSTRLNFCHLGISYAVFCLKKQKKKKKKIKRHEPIVTRYICTHANLRR